MDHRYNPDFRKHVAAQARWATKHDRCLYDIARRRMGTHTCDKCGRTPTLERLLELVRLVDATGTPSVVVPLRPVLRGTAVAYICACGSEQTCTCPQQPVNFAARLIDRMSTVGASSVAQADPLVEAMTDDEAALYGTLRDSFLRAQMIRHRTVERVRKAAVDERTSQGGEVVYFIGSADGKLKIGTSANIEKRFDALQTSASVKLTLLLTIPGGTDLEAELHRRFAHLRESGEWFQHTDELRHFIEGAAFYKGLGAGGAITAPGMAT